MSPQPLSKVYAAMKRRGELKQWSFVFGDALGKRPELAHYPMRIIGIWSRIDNGLIRLLCNLLDAKPSLIWAMYDRIRNERARRNIITEVGQKALANDKPAQDLLKAVMAKIEPSRKARNKFAHHVWATFSALDDGLCLIDPDGLVEIIIDFEDQRWNVRHDREADPLTLFTGDTIPFRMVQVYRKADFEIDLAAANNADLLVGLLTPSLYPRQTKNRDKVRKTLRQALNR